MTTASVASMDLKFEAPGPGTWEHDATHFPKPVFGVLAEVIEPAFDRGMRACMKRYGMLLETFDVRVVHGFPYMMPRVVGAPVGGKPPPQWLFKMIFKTLLRVHPELRRRMKTQRDLFARKPWRETVKSWDESLRAETVARHARLADVDASRLGDADLVVHIRAVRDHAIEILAQDHSMNCDVMVPVGDFVVRVRDWTGASMAEIVHLLRGHSSISAGDSQERRDVLHAIKADQAARALVESDAPAGDVYAKLCAWPGDVGEAMKKLRRIWGNMIALGITIDAPTVDEEPWVTVSALRACLKNPAGRAVDTASEPRMRARVPEEHKAEFDEMLADARTTYRLRDERHLYGAGPCLGIARRVIQEAGRRLVQRGMLASERPALMATVDELEALLLHADASVVPRLSERVRLCDTIDGRSVPARLGPEPPPPPPVEWLPNDGARRAMRALNAYFEGMGDGETVAKVATAISGLAVSGGVHEGTARLCTTSADLDRVKPGDVLVAASTTSAINCVLPVLGAIVTDRGGSLSHAAIVCREYGIPGVVGTRKATAEIRDGARVRVDGTLGTVTVLS